MAEATDFRRSRRERARYTLNMKRWLVRIAVCLILGAIITVALAWGIAKYATSGTFLGIETPNQLWASVRIPAMPDEPETVASLAVSGGVVFYAFGQTIRQFYDGLRYWDGDEWIGFSGEAPIKHRRFVFSWIVTGWPCPAMEGGSLLEWKESGIAPVETRLGSVRLHDSFAHRGLTMERSIPLRPRWPGLAVNSLLFASVLFCLSLIPVMWTLAAARMRRIRGRCITCGYDLRGQFDAGCPECGWNRLEEATN